MDELRPHVVPGVTTGELDRIVREYTLDHGHTPATLGYHPEGMDEAFPGSICTSVNDVVCHGIPSDREVLKEGDILNCDLTTIVDGWYGDSSETFLLGKVSKESRRLVQATFDALWIGIGAVKPWGTVHDIGKAIFIFAKSRGYGVVRNFQGHGLGREFHQEPGVPHYPDPEAKKSILRPGVCFTIEPMLNAGSEDVKDPDRRDHWTVRTKDRRPSAQFEHTVFMTEEGLEVLTLTEDGPREGFQF